VVHSENVNVVFANRLVDAVGKAMKAGATHATVRNDVRLGMPSDPGEAGFQGAKEGGAELDIGSVTAADAALQPPDAASQE